MICILLYFILGMLVVQAGFPLLDGLTALLLTILESAKGYFSVKVAEYNAKMRQITYDNPKGKTNQIGFVFDEEEEEELDDEEVL